MTILKRPLDSRNKKMKTIVLVYCEEKPDVIEVSYREEYSKSKNR